MQTARILPMHALPDEPFGLIPEVPFRVAARRELVVCGAPVELVWLPERRGRQGRPSATRRPFARVAAADIVAREAVWTGDGLALTPNRHPFASRHLLLWSTAPRREPDETMLAVGMALAERTGGTLLVNSIGAAASIPWAHAHLVGETIGFLDALPVEPVTVELLQPDPALAVVRATGFPAALLGLRGPATVRAGAAARLLRHRSCAAFSVVASGSSCWLMPRSMEFPAPHFPQALGSAEVWGRWCYDDEDAFRAATPAMLEGALGTAGFPPDTLATP